MAMTGEWQVLAQIFADRMLNGVVLGIVLTLFGWVTLRAGRGQNARTRFAVWFSIMVAAVTLPFVGGMAGVGGSVTNTALRLPDSWAVALTAVWAVIAAAGLAKIGFGFWQLRGLRRAAKVVDISSLDSAVRTTLREFDSLRNVAVCTSDRVRVPTVIGFSKPTVVLPPWALQELSAVELNAVLLHEMAHLRRRDDWTNLAQEILKALFFFHPALWWIGHSLSMEREMACDDLVLARTANPRAYAECLVAVAEKSFLRRSVALAQAVAGRMQETTRRIVRILDADRSTTTSISRPAVGLVAAFSVVCLVSAPHAPKLVAFDKEQPQVSASATPFSTAAQLGARMIPAALQSPALDASRKYSPAPVVHSRAVRLSSRNIHSNSATTPGAANPNIEPKIEAAKLEARQNVSPHMIHAQFGDQVSYPNAMLLVIQTEQIGADGQVWSISVMRLTVFHPQGRQQLDRQQLDRQDLDRQDLDRKVLDPQIQKGITPKTT